MNILDVYKKYQIMPQLAEHQLRVAAVADLICQNFTQDIDRENIVAGCLLHDMGNIIKFDLQKTKALINQDFDLDFWQKVKDDYIKKYGDDEYVATQAIVKELGVSARIMEIIDSVSFLGAPETAAGPDFGGKIAQYCDDRVAPAGVVSLEDRFSDLRVRYGHREDNSGARDNFERAVREMERQIFANTKIKPDYITDETVKPIIENLKTFNI